MYKIMLAEDEPEVLNAIIRTIRWEAHGFEIPVGCRDGREGIAALEEGFRPDVLIADICMPFVDGLALAEYVGVHSPSTMVVILTGYDDFKYAQQAIKLQVFDYLLKPVTPKSIDELMERLRGALDARSLDDTEGAMRIAGSHFLEQLLSQRLEDFVIEENCRRHSFLFPGRYHLVASIDPDLPAPADIQAGSNLELMRYGLSNIAQELAEHHPGLLVFQGRDGMTKVIAGAGDAAGTYGAVRAFWDELGRTAEQYLKVTVSAGVGEPVAYLDELYLSHRQALPALNYRFFYGENSFICSSDVGLGQSEEIDYFSFEKRFEAAVRAFDWQGAAGALSALVDCLRKNHVPFDRCVLYCQKLIITLIGLTGELVGGPEVATLEKSWEQADFHTVTTLTQLEERTLGLCAKAFELFALARDDSAATQVVKAEQFIKDNYRNPRLSLNLVTEHLAVSTSYFSALFKARTGSTFVEYLTRVRMDKAKQILAMTDRRTYEVADEVGFSDPHYFSVAFKRVTGMTPKEFREYSKTRG